MMGGMEWGWGWMFSGGLMMLLFWGVVIVLVVFTVRGLLGNGGNSTYPEMGISHREDPFQMLSVVHNPALEPIANEANTRLRRVLDHLTTYAST